MNQFKYISGILLRAICGFAIFVAISDMIETAFKNFKEDVAILALGLVLAYLGLLMIRSAKKLMQKDIETETTNYVAQLKANADIINVDLSLCEIKWTGHDATIALEDNSDESLTFLSPTPQYVRDAFPPPSINLPQSVLVYQCDYKGQQMEFTSEVIYKDKITLSFLLDTQKTTCIYIDKNDSSRFLFDISFLDT